MGERTPWSGIPRREVRCLRVAEKQSMNRQSDIRSVEGIIESSYT